MTDRTLTREELGILELSDGDFCIGLCPKTQYAYQVALSLQQKGLVAVHEKERDFYRVQITQQGREALNQQNTERSSLEEMQ